ncbi:MAG TPA: GPW/gp25 family protein [Bacteroidia bacterium]|nr:GPW/gp25 family protein [Bacteroidia bacterium]
MKNYLTQPIDFGGLIRGEEHSKCSLQQSIAQRIHLFLVTTRGEFRMDPDFGCIIWEHDFENMPNVNTWKDKMMTTIKEGLKKYEPRLMNQEVSIVTSQEEFADDKGNASRRIKRRLDIKVKANIRKTNETFLFEETLYISPVWLD